MHDDADDIFSRLTMRCCSLYIRCLVLRNFNINPNVSLSISLTCQQATPDVRG